MHYSLASDGKKKLKSRRVYRVHAKEELDQHPEERQEGERREGRCYGLAGDCKRRQEHAHDQESLNEKSAGAQGEGGTDFGHQGEGSSLVI